MWVFTFFKAGPPAPEAMIPSPIIQNIAMGLSYKGQHRLRETAQGQLYCLVKLVSEWQLSVLWHEMALRWFPFSLALICSFGTWIQPMLGDPDVLCMATEKYVRGWFQMALPGVCWCLYGKGGCRAPSWERWAGSSRMSSLGKATGSIVPLDMSMGGSLE